MPKVDLSPRIIWFLPTLALIGLNSQAADRSLKPEDQSFANDVSTVYKDMGVVQRKAMNKGGRFLLSANIGMDFSDGPYSMYAISANPGYAINDFFEVYALFSPAFINNRRSIVDTVERLQLANGQQATLTSSKAKLQYGIEGLWAPLYGKDSLGLRNIVRSDTYLKLGVSNIQYDSGSGLKLHLGVGKTFFLANFLGLRATISGNYLQSILNGVKSFRTVAILEFGTVIYF